MKFGDVEIEWLGNSGFFICNSKKIYIDPYNLKEGAEKADFVLLTHSHYDHCSLADLRKVVNSKTKIICPVDCQSKIVQVGFPVQMILISPGEELDVSGIKILAFPAYNIDKNFHPQELGGVGYLIKHKNLLIYHAGDTDLIPEMQKLTGYNQPENLMIALLPVGGRFTMTAEEAFDAAKLIKPDVAIPMHYGSVSGSFNDAREFKELCEAEGINVKILERG